MTMKESCTATSSPYDELERRVFKLLEQRNCFDLKQPLLDSLDDIAGSGIELKELAAQWQKEWMAKYSSRLPIDLDQALELCDLALGYEKSDEEGDEDNSKDNGEGSSEGSRKTGEDICVMLPVPSGYFCENEHDVMTPVPLPATGTSWYPPAATCDPITDDEADGVYDEDSESDTDSNPINFSTL